MKMVLECPESSKLTRVPMAGTVKAGFQIMHNGIRVVADGYYGGGMTRLLGENRGCHEPQEEFVFSFLLKILPQGAVMIEGGAYWAFYSMWFLSEVADGKALLIEPCLHNIKIGRRNLDANGLSAGIFHAYIGARMALANDGVEVVSIDGFCQREGLVNVDVLHMDIQGAEADMLRGAARMLSSGAVSYILISTHGNTLHEKCERLLMSMGMQLLLSVPPRESFSVDGLLVAQRLGAPRLEFPAISRRLC